MNFLSTRIWQGEATHLSQQAAGQHAARARAAHQITAHGAADAAVVHLHNALRRLHGQQCVVDANLRADAAPARSGIVFVRQVSSRRAAAVSQPPMRAAADARLAKLVLDDGDLELVYRVIQDRVDEGGLPAAQEARHNLWATRKQGHEYAVSDAV
jgi:hypothetical protein